MLFGSQFDENLAGPKFLDKNRTLDVFSEEDIFRLVFGYTPVEFEYVTSPFREDSDPGAWFEYSPSGKLFFKDFGDPVRTHYDCFNAVQKKFNLPNFFETLKFINSKLGKEEEFVVEPKERVIRSGRRKSKTSYSNYLHISSRKFDLRDKHYWEKYLISKQDLINDKVFAVNTCYFTPSKIINLRDIAYAFTGFDEGRKKIYRPTAKKKFRFISNTQSDDIGQIDDLPPYGRLLVISKSYKDCRVLRNMGLNSVWLQSENTIPSYNKLFYLVKRFKKVVIFYDNDEAGIKGSKKLSEIVNSHLPLKSTTLNLPTHLAPKITDPSDLLFYKGPKSLLEFLLQNNLIYANSQANRFYR